MEIGKSVCFKSAVKISNMLYFLPVNTCGTVHHMVSRRMQNTLRQLTFSVARLTYKDNETF